MSGVSVTAGYYRRQFHNIAVTKNLLGDPDRDYTPFTIVGAVDPELPNGGGEVITMYNLNPNKLGAVDNVSTFSDENTRVYNGFEFSVNARLPHGGFVFGGVTTERTATNNCADLTNSESEQPAVLRPGAAVPRALQGVGRVSPSRSACTSAGRFRRGPGQPDRGNLHL